MNNGFFNKIISGTSGILNTANQIIPLYDEIKPLFKNIINFKNKLKNLNFNQLLKLNNQSEIISENKKEEVKSTYTSSTPQFFL